MNIHSIEGQGTKVIIQIPIAWEENDDEASDRR